MTKKQKRTILSALLAAVFIFSLGMSVRQQILYRKNIVGYNEARQIAGIPKPSDAQPSPEEAPVPSEGLPTQADVNWEALQEINPDVIGWLLIPGTEISYPLLQGRDNQYYLKHDWAGAQDAGGSIFLDAFSHQDFSDFHTIIYGHRMRNGTMFAALKYYNTQGFWQEHPSVYIITDGGTRQYDIFAAYEASVTGPVFQPVPAGGENEWIQSCLESSEIQTGISPAEGSRILTLSTCPQYGYSSRWVVQGYLVQDSPA